LIIDNVDPDHQPRRSPAYNVQTYFTHADHSLVLITSRLASLQPLLGLGIRVGTVATEQARAILENNAGRVIEDKQKA
jgi:hypothetical protein